jgi:hypothetical protein
LEQKRWQCWPTLAMLANDLDVFALNGIIHIIDGGPSPPVNREFSYDWGW